MSWRPFPWLRERDNLVSIKTLYLVKGAINQRDSVSDLALGITASCTQMRNLIRPVASAIKLFTAVMEGSNRKQSAR
jgi:hypothetical protein